MIVWSTVSSVSQFRLPNELNLSRFERAESLYGLNLNVIQRYEDNKCWNITEKMKNGKEILT